MSRPRLARRSALVLAALLLLAMPALRPGPPAAGPTPNRPGTDALGGAPLVEAAVLDVGRSSSAELIRAAERSRTLPGAAGLVALSVLLAMSAGWAFRSRGPRLGGALVGLARVIASRAPPRAL
jgi:hypothetical protein